MCGRHGGSGTVCHPPCFPPLLPHLSDHMPPTPVCLDPSTHVPARPYKALFQAVDHLGGEGVRGTREVSAHMTAEECGGGGVAVAGVRSKRRHSISRPPQLTLPADKGVRRTAHHFPRSLITAASDRAAPPHRCPAPTCLPPRRKLKSLPVPHYLPSPH